MRRIVLAALAALVIEAGGEARAQTQPDVSSANYIMPGCRALIASQPSDFLIQGFCAGIVVTTGLYTACPPPTATNQQKVRVVVAYIDARPARMHEDFLMLAREALQQAWPCRR